MLGSHTESGCNDFKQNKTGDHVTETQERENPQTQEFLIGDILEKEQMPSKLGVWSLTYLINDLGSVPP